MSKLSLLSVILCLSVNSVFSQINFAPEVKRVAVFKNGYAFTFREGAANVADGWAYTNRTPIGVLGTVWGYSTAPNVRVQQLLAAEEAGSVVERVSNIAEFLLANERQANQGRNAARRKSAGFDRNLPTAETRCRENDGDTE